jgi:hypothetical protein
MRVSPAPENTVTEGKVMTATNLKISPLPGRIKSPEELLHEAMSEASTVKIKAPFVGSKQEYVEEYQRFLAWIVRANLDNEYIEDRWNKVLLKTETVGQLRASDIKTREFMLGPWFRQGDACLLYAPAGVGKSFLAMTIGLAVAGGGQIKGLGWKTLTQQKVLLVDGEMPPADLKDRFTQIIDSGWVDGLERETAETSFMLLSRLGQNADSGFIDLAQPSSHSLIEGLAIREQVGLVILDNFTTLTETMEDENNSVGFRQINLFVSKLKRHGISVILVHHANKEGFAFRGSSALAVPYDSIIGMHKLDQTSDNAAQFRIAFEKLRASPSKETMTREVSMSSFGYSVGERLEADANLQSVIKFVTSSDERISVNKASKLLDLNRETIVKKLEKALNEGLLTPDQVERKFIGLPEQVRQALARSTDANGQSDF